MPVNKVIGGEFKISPDVLTGVCHNDLIPTYSLGRTCLYNILQCIMNSVRNADGDPIRVLLPDYICISVAEVVNRLGLSIVHYHVGTDLYPDIHSIDEVISDCECIVLVSYFGMVNPDDTAGYIRKNYPSVKIIIDDVQDFYGFGKHSYYDYCFTSYRKWFCSPDGAEIIQKSWQDPVPKCESVPDYVQYKFTGNLLKNYSEFLGEDYLLELIDKGESLMDKEYLYRCSDISREIIRKIDLNKVAAIRKRNAKILHDGLLRLGVDHVYEENSVPMFVPVIVANRNDVRKHLFSCNIFAPIHWPVSDECMQGDNELYRMELSLICDQRYDEEDMERILREIENAV